jgi:hypothetical protein
MTMTRVGDVRLHIDGLELEVPCPTAMARSVVSCSTVVDQVDGVRCHNNDSVGVCRFPW